MRSDGDDSGRYGVIFNLQRASFYDGPGLRTTVFLKGCPLTCPWCHNPESRRSTPEVSVNQDRCLGCGECRSACPRPGGPLPAGAVLGDNDCLSCGACFAACPTGAREQVGRRWSVAEVVDAALRDGLAYDTSGGGVTFSGGEPLQQAAFVVACAERLRREGVHVAVDTCGLAERDVVVAVAESVDLLLWDVKHMDPARHEALTSAPLAPILANLRTAAAAGVPIWLRVPVIPGVNDDRANLAAVADLAAAVPGVERINLLPYHRTGVGKLGRLGRAGGSVEYAAPTEERLATLAALVAGGGITTAIGG